MKNKLAYFGLLGFLGILGIVTDNKYFLAFFAYFVFFRYLTVKPDELFKLNVQRAATPAFFAGVAGQAITLVITAFTRSIVQIITGFSLSFSVSIVIFIIILTIFEYKESRGI
jgi:hypothetical protein